MTGISKIILKIASSDLSLKEIREFADRIEKQGAYEIVESVERIREIAGAWEKRGFGYSSSKYKNDNDVASRVERILIQEKGLLKSEAAHLLLQSLYSDGESPGKYPEMKRESFSNWVSKLVNLSSSSIVLHHAEKIRRKTSNMDRPSAWPLRASDE